MREASFRERLERWRQSTEEDERKKKLLAGTNLESNLAELERRVQRQMDYYAQFRKWAATNIEEGGL